MHTQRTEAFENSRGLNLSIDAIQKAYTAGELTAAALTGFYLKRMVTYDAQLNSIIEINPEAMSIAAAMDRERQNGKIRSPLHGIPILLKDNIDTADLMHTSAGSLALSDHFAQQDAFIVRKLREAGAIILGKTNMTELAHYTSYDMKNGYSSRGGKTINPYGAQFSTSGSSSGSAVALAADFSPLAIGTETHGSITWPALANSVVGLKPTQGLVSRTGLIPISTSQDTAGPMARCVRDCAYLLACISGEDTEDAATWGHARPDYLSALERPVNGMRVGIVHSAQAPFSSEQAACAETAFAALEYMGVQLERHVEMDETAVDDRVLMHEFKQGLERYLSKTPPGTQCKTLSDIIAYNRAHPSECLKFGQSILEEALALNSSGKDGDYIYQLIDVKNTLREGLEALLSQHALDALVWPGRTEIPAISGYPAIAIPCGYPGGKPFGLTLMSAPGADGTLLALGGALEKALDCRRPPKL